MTLLSNEKIITTTRFSYLWFGINKAVHTAGAYTHSNIPGAAAPAQRQIRPVGFSGPLVHEKAHLMIFNDLTLSNPFLNEFTLQDSMTV